MRETSPASVPKTPGAPPPRSSGSVPSREPTDRTGPNAVPRARSCHDLRSSGDPRPPAGPVGSVEPVGPAEPPGPAPAEPAVASTGAPASRGRRMAWLDALRGFAALCVVFSHLSGPDLTALRDRTS